MIKFSQQIIFSRWSHLFNDLEASIRGYISSLTLLLSWTWVYLVLLICFPQQAFVHDLEIVLQQAAKIEQIVLDS